MEKVKARTRRRHDRELKQQVLDECAAPGASVATIAMTHGLNANLVHKWRREASAGSPAASSGQTFVAVALPVPAAEPQPIQLELQRGALCVKVNWPLSSAPACAAWLREILR
jgi:transposase